MRLHFEPVVVVPVGPLSNATGPGIGALIGGAHDLSDRWEVVGRAGYIAGSETGQSVGDVTTRSSISYAPFVGGLNEYVVKQPPFRLYVMGEAGPVWAHAVSSANAAAVSVNTSETAMYLGTAATVRLELDRFDVRAGLFTADPAHADTSSSFVGSIAFEFAAL